MIKFVCTLIISFTLIRVAEWVHHDMQRLITAIEKMEPRLIPGEDDVPQQMRQKRARHTIRWPG